MIIRPYTRIKTLLTFALFCLLNSLYCSQSPVPLSKIDEQLARANKEFQIAKEMFNPWYAGPLLTPSGNVVPLGHFNIQPYLFITDTYGNYNQKRKSISISHIWTVETAFIYQMGLLPWMDFTITPQAVYSNQGEQTSYFIEDLPLTIGIQILKEKTYIPALKISISELFPTGKYKQLDPSRGGIDATGTGSYITTLSLTGSKVIWWIPNHPLAYRASLNYSIPSVVSVKGFNAYGGGYGTSGTVKPGNSIAFDTSLEYSLFQKWVLALDLVYQYESKSTFEGTNGISSTGETADVGSPSNDNLSLAPAIEYNPSSNIGFVAGVWFSVTGRNSSSFASTVLTFYYYW